MGDSRTYENICLLRAVTSEDGMTADYFNFPKNFFDNISNKIINNVKGINRVVYDITSNHLVQWIRIMNKKIEKILHKKIDLKLFV